MSDNKGLNDPKFEDAKKILSEDGVVLSVNLLKGRLSIGDARAKAILEALKPMIVHTKADDDLLGGDSQEGPSAGVPQSQDSVSANPAGVGASDTQGDGLPQDGSDILRGTDVDSPNSGSDGGSESPTVRPSSETGSSSVNTPVSPSQESDVAEEDVKDDASAPGPDSGAGSRSLDETVIGVDPMTGKPVRVCDQ